MHDPTNVGAVFPATSVPSELPAFAARAEEAGLDAVWLVEDCFFSGGIALSATALAATQRLVVGLGLMPAAVRNPAIAAMELATLCNLYPGRFEPSFGHGVREWMEQIGATPAQRLRTLGETTAVVRALLAGQTVTTETPDLQMRQVTLAHVPQRPPPVLIGTVGPRALALAGRLADGILLPEGSSPEFVEWAIGATRAAAPQRCVVYAWLSVDDDPARARARLRPLIEAWVAEGVYPEARRIAAELHAVGVRSFDWAGAVERVSVCGDAPACAAAIRRLGAAGADTVVVMPPPAESATQLRVFASEVLPLL